MDIREQAILFAFAETKWESDKKEAAKMKKGRRR